jgi:hypothetical protein
MRRSSGLSIFDKRSVVNATLVLSLVAVGLSAGLLTIDSQSGASVSNHPNEVLRGSQTGFAGTTASRATCAQSSSPSPYGCDYDTTVPVSGVVPSGVNPNVAKMTKEFSSPSTSTDELGAPLGSITTDIPPAFSTDYFLTTNAWINDAGSQRFIVFAGSTPNDATQGGVVVESESLGTASSSSEPTTATFLTSGQDGTLTITSANGWILTLQATDGATYQFDVTTDTLLEI